MPHFACGTWEVPDGLVRVADNFTGANYTANVDNSPEITEIELVTYTAERSGWVRVTIQGVIRPDSNGYANVYSTQFGVSHTTPGGNSKTLVLLSLSNSTIEVAPSGLYAFRTSRAIYVKSGTSISVTFTGSVSSAIDVFDVDGLVKSSVTIEYDR